MTDADAPDEAEVFRRAADQVFSVEMAMDDVDLNAVAYLSDTDVRRFLQAKKTIAEIAEHARHNQHAAEGRRSGGVGETVAGPGGDPQ